MGIYQDAVFFLFLVTNQYFNNWVNSKYNNKTANNKIVILYSLTDSVLLSMLKIFIMMPRVDKRVIWMQRLIIFMGWVQKQKYPNKIITN